MTDKEKDPAQDTGDPAGEGLPEAEEPGEGGVPPRRREDDVRSDSRRATEVRAGADFRHGGAVRPEPARGDRQGPVGGEARRDGSGREPQRVPPERPTSPSVPGDRGTWGTGRRATRWGKRRRLRVVWAGECRWEGVITTKCSACRSTATSTTR